MTVIKYVIYAIPTTTKYNEGRQCLVATREGRSVLKQLVNISADRCRTRRRNV